MTFPALSVNINSPTSIPRPVGYPEPHVDH